MAAIERRVVLLTGAASGAVLAHERVPGERRRQRDEIVATIATLPGPEVRCLAGQALHVDGGLRL